MNDQKREENATLLCNICAILEKYLWNTCAILVQYLFNTCAILVNYLCNTYAILVLQLHNNASTPHCRSKLSWGGRVLQQGYLIKLLLVVGLNLNIIMFFLPQMCLFSFTKPNLINYFSLVQYNAMVQAKNLGKRLPSFTCSHTSKENRN